MYIKETPETIKALGYFPQFKCATMCKATLAEGLVQETQFYT